MGEKVFYESHEIRVTNSRFVVGKQTHAMNGVTSVESHTHKPSRLGWIIGLLFGLMLALGGEGGTRLLGIVVAAGCGFALYSQKATHAVVLRSSSGETEALVSKDENFIGSVVNALNDAIVFRG